MSWNWDHLRYFLALAERGTLSDAARELDVSHTTVLRRLRAFESELSTTLFDHLSSGYRLTAEGDRLYAEAVKMNRAMQELARDIGGSDDRIAGRVVITSTDTLGLHVLPPLLVELQALHPALELELSVSNVFSDIGNREADIAIRTCREPPPELIGRHVGDIRFVPCCSRAYAEDHGIDRFPADTAGHRFVQLDARYRNVPFYAFLEERLDKRAMRMTVSAFIYALELCRAGAGIAVLPGYLVDNDAGLMALVHDGVAPTNPLWLLSPVALRDVGRVRAVRRFLGDRLPSAIGTACAPVHSDCASMDDERPAVPG